MRVKAVVALPAISPPSVRACVEEGLREEFPAFKFDFKLDGNIEHPEAREFEPDAVYWGSEDGDPDESSRAYLEGINTQANELYRSCTDKNRKAELHLRAEQLGLSVHYSNAGVTESDYECYYIVAQPDGESYAEHRVGGPVLDLDAVESFIAEKEAKGA